MDTELFELYKNLIRCRAVSADIEAVNKSEKLLLAYLQKQGLYCTEEMIDGRVVVYASTMPGKVQDLLLNAHLDVVPAAYEEQFEPIKDVDWSWEQELYMMLVEIQNIFLEDSLLCTRNSKNG